jgi:hypothetical protein
MPSEETPALRRNRERLNELRADVPPDKPFEEQPLFEVQVLRTVGAVRRGGKVLPHVAAFVLIAELAEDGEYRFTLPGQDEDLCTKVTVQWEAKT